MTDDPRKALADLFATVVFRPDIFGLDDRVPGPSLSKAECALVEVALRQPPTASREAVARIKKKIRDYGYQLLNEAEHAQATGAGEAQFAATAGAAVVSSVLEIIDREVTAPPSPKDEPVADNEAELMKRLRDFARDPTSFGIGVGAQLCADAANQIEAIRCLTPQPSRQNCGEPVAWTNEAQLGFLKDEKYSAAPMAMWAKPCNVGFAVDVPLYRAALANCGEGVRESFALAISHLDHMAAWISHHNAGYSFESLGEDMPGIRAALAALPVGQKPEGDDAETCVACSIALRDGDMVLNDADGGFIHAACCGPERESYFGADGGPLKESEPIPEPWPWPPTLGTNRPAARLTRKRTDA